MRILHLSDLHIKRNYNDNEVERLYKEFTSPIQRLQEILDQVNKEQVDYILLTGDLIHEGNEEDYLYLKNTLEMCTDIPYICALGNHDDWEASHCLLTKAQRQYGDDCFYYKGYRFIIMDSSKKGSDKGYYSGEQLSWLSQQLQTQTEKGSFLICHHPIVWPDKIFKLDQEEELKTILSKSDVRAIFCGHVHQNKVITLDRMVQISAESLMCGFHIEKGEVHCVERAGYGMITIDDTQIDISFYPIN